MYDTAALLRSLLSNHAALPFLAFRSGEEGRVLVGDPTKVHVLRPGDDAAAFGARIDALAAAGATLFGFTSYECFCGTGRDPSPWPVAVLCEMTAALELDAEGTRGRSDPGFPLDAALAASLASAPPARDSRPRAVRDGNENWPAFLAKLRRIRDWAQTDLGKYRRLTLSRTVHIDDDIDAVGSFIAYRPSGLSRAFLFRCGDWQVLGQSPELLVEGDADAFHMYKLSGTWPRSPDVLEDDELLHEMLRSEKLRTEHEGSIIATEARLSGAGRVQRGTRFVQTLPELRHFVTRLDVHNDRGTGLWGILRAASPSGAYPAAEALALLRELETRPRGPYYGLVGYAQGTRRLEFSQTIRSLLKHGESGWFARVGAAVTEDSLPQQELDETRTKLRNISYRA